MALVISVQCRFIGISCGQKNNQIYKDTKRPTKSVDFISSYFSLFSNMVFINLCTSFAAAAVTGHSKVLNFSSRVRAANFGSTISNLLYRQFLSAANTGHCTKKWNSLSTLGSGGGLGVLGEGVLGCGVGGPEQQNWQVLCSTGVTGLVCLPRSILRLWLLTRNLLRKHFWFLFLTRST